MNDHEGAVHLACIIFRGSGVLFRNYSVAKYEINEKKGLSPALPLDSRGENVSATKSIRETTEELMNNNVGHDQRTTFRR